MRAGSNGPALATLHAAQEAVDVRDLGQSFLDGQRTHPRNVRVHMRPDHRTHLDARLEVKARCRNEPRECGSGWRGFIKLDTRDDRLAGADAFRKRALAQAGTGASVAEEVCCRGRHA